MAKAVAFLTTLGIGEEVDCVVDVNLRKDGTFLAGTGHVVVAPDRLAERAPHVVIVMNPVYREEIAGSLAELSLRPHVLTVSDVPQETNRSQPHAEGSMRSHS